MQNVNPLFPSDNSTTADNGYILPRQEKRVEPLKAAGDTDNSNVALNIIREKLARIYADEPNPIKAERKTAEAAPQSKHQQFMYELNSSGKSLAEIQTAWHAYYANLPDTEKYQVWQEFYEANDQAKARRQQQQPTATPFQPHQTALPGVRALSQSFAQFTHNAIPQHLTLPKLPSMQPTTQAVLPAEDKRTPAELKQVIRNKVTAGGKLKLRHHLQSLTFGLTIGFLTLVIALFGLFNEVVIAPFIQPSRTVSATPIIIDPSSVTTSTTPEVIIPKINLEIPVDYTQTSDDENAIQNALEKGIVHYPSTVKPGQNGNAAFFGHSSNNIFNPGKYKFAFVLLHELAPGDTFYLTYNGKAYIYKVFSVKVVEPTQMDVLNNVPDHTATATLITCDPPGTALHRLVVVGDQISPDPTNNDTGSNTSNVAAASTQIPDNGPSLLNRLWSSIF